MTSNDRNEGQSEFKMILEQDVYRVRDYAMNYFDFIVDVGANIGFFCMMMRFLHPESRIVALEPCKEAFGYLTTNCNMLRIDTLNRAFGDGSRLHFRSRDDILRHMFVDDGTGDYSIESVSLRYIFDTFGIRSHHKYFLKFDCEGGEKFLLQEQGADELIRDSQQTALEVHFKSPRTPYSFWLEWQEYDNWLRDNFTTSHDIDYYLSRRNRGWGHYCLKRKGP